MVCRLASLSLMFVLEQGFAVIAYLCNLMNRLVFKKILNYSAFAKKPNVAGSHPKGGSLEQPRQLN